MAKSHLNMKVSGLHIYPIKSTSPISLQSGQVSKYGFDHDRRWALYGEDGQVLTGRQHPELLDIRCTLTSSNCMVYHDDVLIADLSDGETTSTQPEQVKIFSYDAYGSAVSSAIDNWFSEFIGKSCRLLKVNTAQVRPVLEKHGGRTGDVVAFSDQAPILIITEASLKDLNNRLEDPILMDRFRPNIIIKDADAFAEDNWDIVKVGSTTLRIIQQCERCVFTTIDPITKEKHENKEPLTTLSKYRKGPRGGIIFGVHAVPIDEGAISINDEVDVSSYLERPTYGS